MLNRMMFLLLCVMPTDLLAYVDKYSPNDAGDGRDFVWYVVIGLIVLLVNWIIELFKGKKK